MCTQGTIKQKELEAKKFIFLSNKNNLSFVHRQFSATLCLYLNPKKHVPLHIILHLYKGLSPLKCGRGNPANYQHQPTSWQPQRRVPGETNLCPTLIPTLWKHCLPGTEYQKKEAFCCSTIEKVQGLGLFQIPKTWLFFFLKIQLTAKRLWSGLLEISCMSNYHTWRIAKANRKVWKLTFLHCANVYSFCIY